PPTASTSTLHHALPIFPIFNQCETEFASHRLVSLRYTEPRPLEVRGQISLGYAAFAGDFVPSCSHDATRSASASKLAASCRNCSDLKSTRLNSSHVAIS